MEADNSTKRGALLTLLRTIYSIEIDYYRWDDELGVIYLFVVLFFAVPVLLLV